jgi:hypothetical protein
MTPRMAARSDRSRNPESTDPIHLDKSNEYRASVSRSVVTHFENAPTKRQGLRTMYGLLRNYSNGIK